MLEDRSYMRQSPYDSRVSATVVLLIANVVCFALQLILGRYTNLDLYGYFALSLNGLQQGYVWQFVTYQLMHGGWLHLLLNCWVIYAFGRELEANFGWKRFVGLYFSCGIVGGLLQALAGLLLGSHFAVEVVGASAGAFGLVAAFATLYPERPLTLLLFFVIPVSMRAKFLLLFSGIIAVFGILVPTDNIAHAAHLGGMLAGIGYIRYAMHWNLRLPSLRMPRRRTPRLVKIHKAPATWAHTQPVPEDPLPPEDFLSQEVDPILDKISAHGIQSLTDRERRILESARQRMAKR